MKIPFFRILKFICVGFILSVILSAGGCESNLQNADVTYYRKQLRDKDALIRRTAATNIGIISETVSDSIPELIEALKDADTLVQLDAIATLGKVKAMSEIAVAPLAEKLRDKDKRIGREAAHSLGQIGSPAIPVLVEALKDQRIEVRLNATLALGQIGASAKNAVPILVSLAEDKDLTVRENAIESLGEIGEGAETSLPVLVEALKHPKWEIRASAAHAIGNIGVSAKSAIPQLIATLDDRDAVVRQRAAAALSKIGSIAIPDLITTLSDKDNRIRSQIISVLSEIGLPATPALLEALKSNDEGVRNSAVAIFGKISEIIQGKVNKVYSQMSLAEIDLAIAALTPAQKIILPSDRNDPFNVIGGKTRFTEDAILPIEKALGILQTQKNALFQEEIVNIFLIGLVLLLSGVFILFWFRPFVFLRFSRALVLAKQERALYDQWLLMAKRFLEQAGATVRQSGKRSLQILEATGRLKTLSPLPVLLAITQPTEQDVIELMQNAERSGSDRQKRSGILLYRESPDTLFRVRMAEVRLRDRFVLIPIPLAAVEQVIADSSACVGLLAQYTDRYLPGADLFDDRNAIGDTLSFFGRAELLHRLEQDLLRQQGIGLFGLRKSGKTSILLQLGFAMRQHPVVHLDLQPYGGKPRYGAELFNEILRQLTVLIRDRNTATTHSLEPFSLDRPATALTTDFIQRISKILPDLTKAGYEPPMVLFLDEVERILPLPNDSSEKVEEFNAFFGSLRALSQEQRQLGILVADVHPDCNRINQWQQEGVPTNPVFSFFKEVILSPFSEEETQTMLVDVSRLMGRSFDLETLAAIHHESGGHPFIARQLASLLCTKVSDREDGQIALSEAQRYLNRPFSYSSVLKDYFAQNIWADLKKRNFDAAMSVLRLLACNLNLANGITEKDLLDYLSNMFTESQSLDALLWLEMVGLAIRLETKDNDYYRSNLPLLSNWLQMEMGQEEILQWQIH